MNGREATRGASRASVARAPWWWWPFPVPRWPEWIVRQWARRSPRTDMILSESRRTQRRMNAVAKALTEHYGVEAPRSLADELTRDVEREIHKPRRRKRR